MLLEKEKHKSFKSKVFQKLKYLSAFAFAMSLLLFIEDFKKITALVKPIRIILVLGIPVVLYVLFDLLERKEENKSKLP